MRYASTTLATDLDKYNLNGRRVKLVKIVLFFIPRTNSDIEKLYPKVKKWLLEIGEDGYAVREIALDDEDNVLFCTPNKNNSGFWTDLAEIKFKEEELVEISKQYFESLWCDSLKQSPT